MSKDNPRDETWHFGIARRAGWIGILSLVVLLAVMVASPGDLAVVAPDAAEQDNRSIVATDKVKASILNDEDDSPCLTAELDGQWVLDTNKTFADPFCCEGDDKKYRRNPPQCLNTRPQVDFSGRLDKLAYMRGRGCRCSFRDTYTWESEALIEAFDPRDFCRLLGDRKILLVGDSTMSQSSTTLMNAVFQAGCQTQIAFVMSDTLILENMGALNRGVYWTDAVAQYEPDIVIISSGPHVYGHRNFTRIHDTLLADISILRQTTNITFVWKTQQPAGCTDRMFLQHPFEAAKEMLKVPMEYNHARFFARDSYSIRVMQEHNIPFLDLRMLYSRSEAHISQLDCLHFCSPGPLDIFPNLVHRMLRTNFAVPQCISRKS